MGKGEHLRRTAQYHKTSGDRETYVKTLLHAAIDKNFREEGFYFSLPHTEPEYLEILKRLLQCECTFFLEDQPIVYLRLEALEQRGGLYQRWKHRREVYDAALARLKGAFYKLQRIDTVGTFYNRSLILDLYEYQYDLVVVGPEVLLAKAYELYGPDMNITYEAPYLRFLF